MKTALLKRLKRLEQVQANEILPPIEFQTGYLMRLPSEYTGDRHLVTVGRDPDGTYRWEERRGPEPDDKRTSILPFRVILTSPAEDPAPAAHPRQTPI